MTQKKFCTISPLGKALSLLGFLEMPLNKSGNFWQKDYFDKAIRDDEHFKVVLEYVKNNAYKAGLRDADDRFVYVYDNRCD